MRAAMNPARLSLTVFAAGAILLISGCAEFEHHLNATRRAASDALRTALAAPRARPPYWRGGGVKGAPKIVVRLSEQRAYFYRGKRLVGESNISTGRKGFETPVGRYRVIQKDKDHVSNLYGDYVDEDGLIVVKNVDVTQDPMPDGTEFVGANMPYFLRFTRGYGMHAGFVPRYRASHGCIRMPAEMAERFFDAANYGTPVVVKE